MERPPPNLLAGILLRAVAVSCLALLAALVKLGLAAGVSMLELVFYRSAFGLLPLLIWIAATRTFDAWRTARPMAHIWRGGLGLATMLISVAALGHLPLAEATTISFAAPFFTILLSALVLKEQVERHRWVAVAAGFLGVLVVIQPQGSHLPLAGLLLAVLWAVGGAGVTITLRQIGRTEGTQTVVLWYGMLGTLVLGLFMPFYGDLHHGRAWLIIIALSAVGSAAQIFFTASLRYAPVSVLVPFDFLQLVGAVVLGWLIFTNRPLLTTWVGAIIIILSGLYAVYREHRLGRDKPAEIALF